MYNPFSLKGKRILVTGASSGLGRGISVACSRIGADIVITARNEERLKETLSLMDGSGHQIFTADMMDNNAIIGLADKLPVLDGLVLCAGITRTLPVKHISEDAIHEVMQTNLLSSMLLIPALIKRKKIMQGGRIVFISSIDTFNVNKGNSIYSASKGGVNSFAKVAALELAKQNITVNCIQPGFVPSSFLDKGIITESQIEEERKRYPLGFGEPSDIANGVIYLLSDAAKWVTGSILTIDGGVTLK